MIRTFIFFLIQTEICRSDLPSLTLKGNSQVEEDEVLIVHGKKEKRFDRLLGSGNAPQNFYNHPEPVWRGSSMLIADPPAEGGPHGSIYFQQFGINYIRIIVNGTGFPVGKHAMHIHAFGDLTQGCKTTGPHIPGNFIGNIEAKEGGAISSSFFSPFIAIFGFNGIMGRAVVIHEKPIDINPNISPFIASPSFSVQTEEREVGAAIACGVITITNNLV